MSKVICDVCGTAYPETASQCPICGSAKNSAEQTAAGNPENAESSASYAYVKGGRFSKKNVRRRSRGGSAPTTAQRRSGSSRSVQEDNEPNNTGLVIVVILLLVAIVCVLIYIGIHFFGPKNTPADPTGSGTSQVTPKPGESEDPGDDPIRIPCTAIQLSNLALELKVGETYTITTQLSPENTTDTVAFISAEPAIAAVDPITGEVTMISEGQTVITVICGDITAECTVKTPETVDPGDDPVVPGEFNFEWNTIYTTDNGDGDTTLNAQGKTWKAYKSSLDIDPTLITWTSDNPEIATIKDGVVTAVAPGNTKVHAQYNGVTYTCVVRCAFKVTEDQDKTCALNVDDVSIKIGETFTLKLKDANGYNLDVTWQCDTDGVTINGNKITGATAGTHKVYTVYEGKTYTCIVRIRE